MNAIAIDRAEYEKPIPFYDARGIKIVLHIPPSFIPSSVLGKYIEHEDSFEIKFSYEDQEQDMVLFEDQNIRFIVGKNTKKPTAIIIKKIEAQKISAIMLEQKIKRELAVAFDNAINRVFKPVEKTNLEVTKTVVSNTAGNLASSFVAP